LETVGLAAAPIDPGVLGIALRGKGFDGAAPADADAFGAEAAARGANAAIGDAAGCCSTKLAVVTAAGIEVTGSVCGVGMTS
jgi:hypothetical protein